MARPLLSTFQAPWMRDLFIKEDSSNFENLPPAFQLPDFETLTHDRRLAADRDAYPIPATKDREYYNGEYHLNWWLSGLHDFENIQRSCERHGVELKRYFELGCASGRVVRHAACQSTAEIWCADINARHIEWVRQFLPKRIKALHNTVYPALPLEPNQFDLVSAFSVFTHIDDLEMMWLAELRRIIRPGGLAYVTFCSDQTWENHRSGWMTDVFLPMADRIRDYDVSREWLDRPMPQDKVVLWWQGRDVYNSSVFHTHKYVQEEWGRYFDVIEIVPEGHDYQDVAILRKT